MMNSGNILEEVIKMPISLDTLEAFASIIEGAPAGIEARRAGLKTERLAKEQSVQMEFLRNLQSSQLGLEKERLKWEKTRVPESVQAARERAKGLADLQELENAYRLEAIRLEAELGKLEEGTPEYEETMARARDYNERANVAAQEREMRSGFMEMMAPQQKYFGIKEILRYEPKIRKLEEKAERKGISIKTKTEAPPKTKLEITKPKGKTESPNEAAIREIKALTEKRPDLQELPATDFWRQPEIKAILDKYGVDVR